MAKVHLRYAGQPHPMCGAGKRWMSQDITSVIGYSHKVTCRACVRAAFCDPDERVARDGELARIGAG